MPDLSDTVAKLHRVSPSFYLPPQIQELAENPEKKIFGGMVWDRAWNGEIGYPTDAVVKYAEQAYVCIKEVPPPAAPALGPGAPWEGGLLPITGHISSGKPFSGTLTERDPLFEEGIFLPKGPYRAQAWQLNLSEAELKALFTFTTAMWEAPPTTNKVNALWAVDNGHTTTFGNLEKAGKTEQVGVFLNDAQLVNGTYRFYLIVFGGLLETEVGKPKVVLPTPYEQTFTNAAAIVSLIANKPPPEDPEHWELITRTPLPTPETIVAEIEGGETYPKFGPGGYDKLPVSTVITDTKGWWDPVSLRYKPQVAGYYTVSVFSNGVMEPPGPIDTNILKNGVAPAPGIFREFGKSTGYGPEYGGSYLLHANGTTDYFEVGGNSAAGTYRANVYLQIHS